MRLTGNTDSDRHSLAWVHYLPSASASVVRSHPNVASLVCPDFTIEQSEGQPIKKEIYYLH